MRRVRLNPAPLVKAPLSNVKLGRAFISRASRPLPRRPKLTALSTPIAFRIGDGEIQTIKPSQWSRLLCYLWLNRHRWVTAFEVTLALGSLEVHPRLSELRNKYRVPVDHKPAPKRMKLYRLDPSVVVLEGACHG